MIENGAKTAGIYIVGNLDFTLAKSQIENLRKHLIYAA